MAGEIAHVVYAARLLTHLGSKVDNPTYWVGTLFPDIRHLGVVSRRRTHPRDVALHSLLGKDDFHTGLRVHTWIDATREKFLRDSHIKEQLPWHPFVPFCLNLFEDELLYEYFEDWNLVQRLLNRVHQAELGYISDARFVQQWHTLLQDYFAQKPTDKSRYALAKGIGLSDQLAKESATVVKLLREDGRSAKMLEKFWRHLEDILR